MMSKLSEFMRSFDADNDVPVVDPKEEMSQKCEAHVVQQEEKAVQQKPQVKMKLNFGTNAKNASVKAGKPKEEIKEHEDGTHHSDRRASVTPQFESPAMDKTHMESKEEPKSASGPSEKTEGKGSDEVQNHFIIGGEVDWEQLFLHSGTDISLRDSWFSMIEKAKHARVRGKLNQKICSGRFRLVDSLSGPKLEILPEFDTYGMSSREILNGPWKV